MTRLALMALALTLASPASGADRAPVERLRAAVAADGAHHVDLLERLVNQNSGTLNLSGVRAVGDLMRAELEPLGFVSAGST